MLYHSDITLLVLVRKDYGLLFLGSKVVISGFIVISRVVVM